ncbi:MAG: LytTR family transcriptional regulator DNA-binding domain-containing protein [Cyclobacteriaceae bacterium]
MNRNFIVSNRSIKRMEPYFNNRMLLQLEPACSQDFLVSRSYLRDFKKWIEL